MFRQALRRLVLVDVITATAAVVLLLVAAFLLTRSNLERSAYQSLQEVAETISASDLHELFEDRDNSSDNGFDNGSATAGSIFWIVAADGDVLAAPVSRFNSQLMSYGDAEKAMLGQIQRSVVHVDSENWRVITIAQNSRSPDYVVQVAAIDTVGPDLDTIIRSLVMTGIVGVALAAISGFFVARKALEPLQKAFDLQRDFVSGASHELRTPVTVVQANADALQRLVKNLPDEDAQLLEDIQYESAFLGQLIGRLAELARLQGDNVVPLGPVDISGLLTELGRSMSVLAHRAEMTISVGETNTDLSAIADSVMLRQVVQSLIDNAFRYAGAGSTVELLGSRHGDHCEMIIKDNGIGIPEQHLPHVTERFYRVDKARSRNSGSSGLGLAIADEAIRAMGGTLTIDSADGKGTIATISLPIAEN
ncbi:MAG: hypothetical protein HQ477_06235 [Chloroflexi bacterium]|nr:hypothetical protein [Chloroflexota bacterium]